MSAHSVSKCWYEEKCRNKSDLRKWSQRERRLSCTMFVYESWSVSVQLAGSLFIYASGMILCLGCSDVSNDLIGEWTQRRWPYQWPCCLWKAQKKRNNGSSIFYLHADKGIPCELIWTHSMTKENLTLAEIMIYLPMQFFYRSNLHQNGIRHDRKWPSTLRNTATVNFVVCALTIINGVDAWFEDLKLRPLYVWPSPWCINLCEKLSRDEPGFIAFSTDMHTVSFHQTIP